MKTYFNLDLQLFTDGEVDGDGETNVVETNITNNTNNDTNNIQDDTDVSKVIYTQEDVDKIIKERLVRESKKKNQDSSFEQLSEKDRELQKTTKENEDLRERLENLEKITMKSEVISQYAKLNLPCVEDFNEIVGLFTSINDTEQRVKAFNSFTNYINKVQQINKQVSLNKQLPAGSNKTSNTVTNNPFAAETINYTEAFALIKSNIELAKQLAIDSNNYDEFKTYFN